MYIMFKQNLFFSRVQIHDVAEKVVFCRFFYDYRGKINEFSLGVVFSAISLILSSMAWLVREI